MEQKYQYNTVEEAIRDLQDGKIILVTDDPDRENEGDMICAAQFATLDNINFMATHAMGLICTPMSAELAAKLNFPQMVSENTDNHETAFTVSIDHVDTTTGISAAERAYTMMKSVDDTSRPEDFRRPGHVFPLVAKKGGVLVRNGHTEATTDLVRLAGLKECGVCCEIMKEDGTMMRTSELWELAHKYHLTFITIKDLQDYLRIHEKHVKEEAAADLPTQYGEFKIHGYVNYAGEAISLTADCEEELLKSAEYGAGLYFSLMDADATELQNTKYTQYFGANYEASKDELFAIYTRYQKELGSVFHQRIVDHAILDSGITLTVYEDGTKVYVNYNYDNVTMDGIEIPARDYLVMP